MSIETYLHAMPKVELHVHLEGAILPQTLLNLAKRHHVALPADSVEGLKRWYTFTDFNHFIEIYLAISNCIRTLDDIELIARDFIAGQAAQNVLYTEATYTAYTHYLKGLAFEDQLAALNRARAWGEAQYGVRVNYVIDIARHLPPEESLQVADWVIAGYGRGVAALGLGGPEVGFPPELFAEAFARVEKAGIPAVPHAGETVGPESIWGALRALNAQRIGHGVRCLENPALVEELRHRQIPLEVCPTSNVCLHVAQDLPSHPLPRLLAEGLLVTVNSDDPPLFNTSINQEYVNLHSVFGLDAEQVEQLALNAARSALLPPEEKSRLEAQMREGFARLRPAHQVE